MNRSARTLESASFALAVVLLAVPASAATWAVDQDGQATPTNCDAVNPAYVSIGAAVAAVPSGDTIVVCPGTAPYNEQLIINKALTIRGFAQTEVVIAPTPMVANTTSLYSGGPIAAVVVVADVTATLSNLVIDGVGADMGGTDCSAPNIVGIFYRNADGTVSDSTVRNIRLAAGLEGCQGGLGIFAQSGAGGTSTLTVDGVNVHDYQKNGIVANEVGTTVTVRNSVVSGDPATNVSVQNGIQVAFGATGSITSNRVINQIYSPCTYPYVAGGGCDAGVSLGIIVFDAGSDLVVSTNTIGNTQGGVYIGGGIIETGTHGTEVFSNSISATRVFHGIVVLGDGSTLSKNSITDSDGVGVLLSGNGNLVIYNRIQGAPLGIWNYSGTGNSYPTSGARSNTLFNVGQASAGGPLAAQVRTASAGAQPSSALPQVPTPGRF